jgi:AhpD family alkylhydroperoxidase
LSAYGIACPAADRLVCRRVMWQRLAVLAKVFHVDFHLEKLMATFGLIEYSEASPEVRAIYDDIMATRKTDWINNFWKAIAHDPATLKRTWESIKQIMAPGALDPLTKELIYIAVSVTNNCHYCIASHTASAFKKGMSDAMFKELQAVIGMANETNKLVTGYQVAVDEQFLPPLKR